MKIEPSANKRILRLPEVKVRTGLSRSTLYLMIREKKFPACIKIGARSVGWIEKEISDWIEARANLRDAKTAQEAA